MKRIGSVCALVLVSSLAAAQPKTPGDWFKEGENQYNLGNFDKAIEAFKKGFELETTDSKKSAYLYNIAQAYRQAKDCSNATFFYKRFLAMRDADPSKPLPAKVRKDVEDRLRELDECARQQEAIKNRPPGDLRPEDQDKTTPEAKPDVVAVKPDGKNGAGDGPRLLSARLIGGGAKISAGDLDVPVQATGALIAGYPIRVAPQLTIEAGAGFSFTPVPYQNADGSSHSGKLYGVVANAGVVYAATPKIHVRADVGVGVLLFSGVSMSPFTDGAAIDGGALSMLHVRAGLSADYAFTPNLFATLAPIAFSYSPPKDGLREDIKSITALDFMAGIGYRM
ncbi:MAG: hypothetical protein ACTHU0_36360 [Kofleriaceae bacterium]